MIYRINGQWRWKFIRLIYFWKYIANSLLSLANSTILFKPISLHSWFLTLTDYSAERAKRRASLSVSSFWPLFFSHTPTTTKPLGTIKLILLIFAWLFFYLLFPFLNFFVASILTSFCLSQVLIAVLRFCILWFLYCIVSTFVFMFVDRLLYFFFKFIFVRVYDQIFVIFVNYILYFFFLLNFCYELIW